MRVLGRLWAAAAEGWAVMAGKYGTAAVAQAATLSLRLLHAQQTKVMDPAGVHVEGAAGAAFGAEQTGATHCDKQV